MSDTWELLISQGVPDGAPRPPPRSLVRGERLREALRTILSTPGPKPRRVAPLLAWLRAFRHHWPEHFRRTLGVEGDTAIQTLQDQLEDENHYLKLRRIATENLSHAL